MEGHTATTLARHPSVAVCNAGDYPSPSMDSQLQRDQNVQYMLPRQHWARQDSTQHPGPSYIADMAGLVYPSGQHEPIGAGHRKYTIDDPVRPFFRSRNDNFRPNLAHSLRRTLNGRSPYDNVTEHGLSQPAGSRQQSMPQSASLYDQPIPGMALRPSPYVIGNCNFNGSPSHVFQLEDELMSQNESTLPSNEHDLQQESIQQGGSAGVFHMNRGPYHSGLHTSSRREASWRYKRRRREIDEERWRRLQEIDEECQRAELQLRANMARYIQGKRDRTVLTTLLPQVLMPLVATRSASANLDLREFEDAIAQYFVPNDPEAHQQVLEHEHIAEILPTTPPPNPSSTAPASRPYHRYRNLFSRFDEDGGQSSRRENGTASSPMYDTPCIAISSVPDRPRKPTPVTLSPFPPPIIPSLSPSPSPPSPPPPLPSPLPSPTPSYASSWQPTLSPHFRDSRPATPTPDPKIYGRSQSPGSPLSPDHESPWQGVGIPFGSDSGSEHSQTMPNRQQPPGNVYNSNFNSNVDSSIDNNIDNNASDVVNNNVSNNINNSVCGKVSNNVSNTVHNVVHNNINNNITNHSNVDRNHRNGDSLSQSPTEPFSTANKRRNKKGLPRRRQRKQKQVRPDPPLQPNMPTTGLDVGWGTVDRSLHLILIFIVCISAYLGRL